MTRLAVLLVLQFSLVTATVACGKAQLQENLRTSQQFNSALRTELVEVQQAQAQLTTQVEGLTADKVDLTTQVEGLAADMADLTTQVEGLAAYKADLTTQLEGLTADKADLTTQLEGLTADKADLTTQVEGLAADKADLRTQLEGMTADKADLTTQVEGLASDKADLTRQVEGLAADKADLTTQMEGLAADKAGLTTQVEWLAAVKAGLTTQVEGLTADKASLTTQVEGLTADKAGLTTQVEGMTADKADLTTQVEGLTTDLTNTQTHLARAQAAITALEADYGTLEELRVELGELRAERTILLETKVSTIDVRCTGSMNPTITCLDEITEMDPPPPKDIVVGAMIIYRKPVCLTVRNSDTGETFSTSCDYPTGWVGGSTVLHRVIEVIVGENGEYSYKTQGDNNPEPDNYTVPYGSIVGLVTQIQKNTVSYKANLHSYVKNARAGYPSNSKVYRDTWDNYCRSKGAQAGCRVTSPTYEQLIRMHNQVNKWYDYYNC